MLGCPPRSERNGRIRNHDVVNGWWQPNVNSYHVELGAGRGGGQTPTHLASSENDHSKELIFSFRTFRYESVPSHEHFVPLRFGDLVAADKDLDTSVGYLPSIKV